MPPRPNGEELQDPRPIAHGGMDHTHLAKPVRLDACLKQGGILRGRLHGEHLIAECRGGQRERSDVRPQVKNSTANRNDRLEKPEQTIVLGGYTPLARSRLIGSTGSLSVTIVKGTPGRTSIPSVITTRSTPTVGA